MGKGDSIVDVLADLPAEKLAKMQAKNQRDLDRARGEVARLELQQEQLEMAVAKRDRGKPGRRGALTPETVLDATMETEPPATASDVHRTLVARGLGVSVNAVRNHLNRLVESGDLDKEGNTFVVASPTFVPAKFVPPDHRPEPDDDIQF
jgi:hypothetical protein